MLRTASHGSAWWRVAVVAAPVLAGFGIAARAIAVKADVGSANGPVLPIVELRQYTLKPGQRDVLIELFDREFLESQEDTGMTIIGQFRDLDRPDRFVWIRAFPDMPSRERSLTEFYGGPVWKAHGRVAGGTMIDSSNVLMLRPARDESGFTLDTRRRPPPGASHVPTTLVVAAIYSFDMPVDSAFLAFFEREVRTSLERAGAGMLGYFVTDPAPNNFPRLPVREGENVFVWIASFPSAAAYAAHLATPGARQVAEGLKGRLKRAPEVLSLSPTSRSALGR